MNKKYLMFALLGLFGIGIVSAIAYYAVFSTTINVSPSITLSGDCEDTVSGYSGDTIVGDECVITNNAPSDRELVISSDSVEGITTSYMGSLVLAKKDTSTWNKTEDTISINYTVIGDSFEVTGVPGGYTAIYYKDAVVGLEGRLENPQPAISIVGIGNLPQEDDANMNASANYCQEPDNYNQCRGAKLWVVPTEDLSDSTLTWEDMADYYYETDLIQYNSDGNIVLSPRASLTIRPVYELANDLSGTYEVTTHIA